MHKTAAKLSILVLALILGSTGCRPRTDTASPPETPAPTPEITASPATIPDTPDSPDTPDLLSDTTILPGERVGPITQTTTRDALVKQFGEDRLTDESVDVGEGFTEPSTRVDLGADLSFTVVWVDETQTQPREVRNLGSAWKVPQDIGIGTSFAELQDKLGQFELYGLGWDYGGTIDLANTPLEKYEGLLILRLQPSPSAIKQAQSDYESVLGDSLYPSSDPHFQTLDLTINEIIVDLGASPTS